MSDYLQAEFKRLKQREATLKQQLSDKQKQMKDLQGQKVAALRNQMRRVQTRINAQERKQDTRWKILIGATVLARAANDPAAADRLDRMMDEVLTEDRDRQLLERWRGLRRSATATDRGEGKPEGEKVEPNRQISSI